MKKRAVLVGTVPVAVIATAAIIMASARKGSGQATAAETTTVAFEAPVDVDTVGLPGPRQPIFFRHDVHAGQYKIDCQYCHRFLDVSPKPGIPTMVSCMGCHLIVGTGNPEVEKLREAYNARRPVEWVEVHYLPPFVHFPHYRHVRAEAKLECKDCHGEVDRMPQVYQYASLKMGWCLDCHKSKKMTVDGVQRPVTTDCTVCHY